MPPPLLSEHQLKNRDIDTLKRFLRHKLGGYTVAIKDMTTNNLLYRGVRWHDPPKNIQQLSYPPAELVKELGRANREGVSMFYASRAAPAVFYELKAREGERISLSEWELLEPLWMHNLGYHPDALRRLGVTNMVARQHLSYPIPGETRDNARLRHQLSLAFTKEVRVGEEHWYKQSIAINELLFDRAEAIPLRERGPRSTRVAGTIYPAMGMRGAADNVAMLPEFVDLALRLKSVRHVRIEAADESRSAYTFLTLALSRTFAGSDIIWAPFDTPDIERRSHIALEDGRWVLRDGYGRIYDLH